MPGRRISAGERERDDTPASRCRRARARTAVTITLVLTGVVSVEPARAGTYVMRNCDVPGHGNAPMHPWGQTDNVVPNVSMVDACATGGGVSFNLGPSRAFGGGYSFGINLQRPTGPRSQISFVKLVLWYAARLAGSGQPMLFWSSDLRSDGSWHPALSDAPPGSENVVAEQQLSPDTRAVHLGVQCGPGGVVSPEPCVSTHGAPLLIRGMEVTLREDVPPIILRPSGTLLGGGPQTGIRTLTYSASDAQSGITTVDVLLGETLVASRDLTTRCSYSDFTVCPASEDGTLQVDTRNVANGPHRLTVRVRDAAGNVQEAHSEGAVEVLNERSIAASAEASTYILTARFKGTSRSTLTVPFSRGVAVVGRLSQLSQPVPEGSLIEVHERRDHARTSERTRAPVKTKADGSFSVALVTTRPSRTVRLVYRPTASSQVVSRALKLRVRAASRVRASLRGRTVRFSGRVLSRPVPRAGKRIVMEGRSPRSAWTAFKTLRTDREGRFSGTYRLRVRRPGVTLKVRAVVPRENGYGYLGSRSRAVTFRVR